MNKEEKISQPLLRDDIEAQRDRGGQAIGFDSELKGIARFKQRVQSEKRRLNRFYTCVCVGLLCVFGGSGVAFIVLITYLLKIMPDKSYLIPEWYNQMQPTLDNSTCAAMEPDAGCVLMTPVLPLNETACFDLLEDICENCVIATSNFQPVPDYCFMEARGTTLTGAIFGLGAILLLSACVLCGYAYKKCDKSKVKVKQNLVESEELKVVEQKLPIVNRNDSMEQMVVKISDYETAIEFFVGLKSLLNTFNINNAQKSPSPKLFSTEGLINIVLGYLDPESYEIRLMPNGSITQQRRIFYIADKGSELEYAVFEDKRSIKASIPKSELKEITTDRPITKLREFWTIMPAILQITATRQHTYPEEKRVTLSAGRQNNLLVYNYSRTTQNPSPVLITHSINNA